jgi:hypothetical protein
MYRQRARTTRALHTSILVRYIRRYIRIQQNTHHTTCITHVLRLLATLCSTRGWLSGGLDGGLGGSSPRGGCLLGGCSLLALATRHRRRHRRLAAFLGWWPLVVVRVGGGALGAVVVVAVVVVGVVVVGEVLLSCLALYRVGMYRVSPGLHQSWYDRLPPAADPIHVFVCIRTVSIV